MPCVTKESAEWLEIPPLPHYSPKRSTWNRLEKPNRHVPVYRAHPAVLPASTSGEDLAEFVSRLLQLKLTKPDWNGLGSDPPTFEAIGRAISVLWALKSMWIEPARLTASAEGGVAITFRRGRRFASIESLNSGELVLLTSDGTGNPRAREMEASDDALNRTAQDLREYFEL